MTGADSAGQSFGGRALTGTGFDHDTGAADPDLRVALTEGDAVRLMNLLEHARLLVPIVATAGDTQETDGLTVEKSSDMAVVTLTAGDGQRALPAFSGIDSLIAWDSAARPTPVTAAKAAQAAVAEGCDVIVLDLAGPVQVTLRSSMVWALAQDRPWAPPDSDPVVQHAVQTAARADERVVAATCEPDPNGGGALRIVLTLPAGLPAAELQEIATGFGERLATDGEVRARIDALTFSVRPASST